MSGQAQTDRDDVRRLAGRRVLVVGDLVLDEYVTGRPARISREAPVLILDVVEREDRAGSAANPAANVTALGSQATVVGVVGCDPAGARKNTRDNTPSVVNVELVRGNKVEITVAYNYLRRKELNIGDATNGLTGFSLGVGVLLKKWQLRYARSYYQNSTAYNQFGINLSLND